MTGTPLLHGGSGNRQVSFADPLSGVDDADACAPQIDPSDHYTDRMIRQLTATQAKATFLAVLDDVASGEEIEITKHGHTVARLVPASHPRALKGRLAGIARTACADEDLYSTGEVWNAS